MNQVIMAGEEKREIEMSPIAIMAMCNVSMDRAVDLMRGYDELKKHGTLRGEPQLAKCDITGDVRWIFLTINDNPVSIATRYMRIFNEESKLFIEKYRAYCMQLDHANGMSQGGLSKLVCDIPEKLHMLFMIWDRNFFEQPKFLRSVLQEFSYLAAKR